MATAKKRAVEEKPAKAASVKAPRRKKVVATAVESSAVETPALDINALDITAAPDTTELPPSVAKQGKTLRYLLPANMEIAALGPVHSELVALEASNAGPFVLDGANLSVIDTAGLQLLISFVSAVQSSGKKVSWDNYSVQAYQLANELGVVDQLGD
jgi:ABC-type transporter Mla MlaB component